MARKAGLILAAALFFATPAFAAHCLMDAAAIDAGLQKLSVSDDVRSQVTALRDEGMQLHEAGNHAEAESKLSEGMRMLLNAD